MKTLFHSIKPLLKLVVLVVIVALILKKIDENVLLLVMKEAKPGWVVWAIIWFMFSKVIGAFRFNVLLRTEGIHLSELQNIRLYWVGMYYNLLLPGGISGDGYKIKLLMDRFGRSFKSLFAITLLDRLTGAIALGQLILLLLTGIPTLSKYWWLWIGGIVFSIPCIWGLYRWFGKGLEAVWQRVSIQSIGTQAAQTIATFGLIIALGQGVHWVEYSVLFLVSSVVAMLPLTIGGAGARELTFLYGAGILGVEEEKAVAIALLFYLISTAVALVGIGFIFHKNILTNPIAK